MPRSRGRKQKAKGRSDSATQQQRGTAAQLQRQPSLLEQLRHKWWFRIAEWALGFAVLLLTIIAGIYQITGGPPWPTDPVFSAEIASSASPFDNPFDVTNKSGLVDIRDLSIHCEILRLKSKRITVTEDFRGKLLLPSRGPNPVLLAGAMSPFTCQFREAMDRIGFGADSLDDPTEAQIRLIGAYDTPWWWHGFWFNPHRETPTGFTLDVKTIPPRWMIGVPLK